MTQLTTDRDDLEENRQTVYPTVAPRKDLRIVLGEREKEIHLPTNHNPKIPMLNPEWVAMFQECVDRPVKNTIALANEAALRISENNKRFSVSFKENVFDVMSDSREAPGV